ncbi:MAG: hypothetical protein ACK5XN_38875 [Bacteroidota bacterium]
MIQVIHDNSSALIHESSGSHDATLWEANNYIQNQLKNGYIITQVTIGQTAGRWIGTSIVLSKPKKAAKKPYPYWLRKKM